MGRAQVTLLSGTTFGGSFLTPLALGQTVYASESLETPLEGGAVFTYESENDRPVGACPPPATSTASATTTAGPAGRDLQVREDHDPQVPEVGPDGRGDDQPAGNGHSGSLPAGRQTAGVRQQQKGKHHHPRSPPAQLVARGSATAKSAGTVSVLIKVTAKGRRLLSHRGQVQLVLVTTLSSTSGAKLNLARRTVTLKR